MAVYCSGRASAHPLTDMAENTRLFHYEQQVKEAFSRIEPALRRLSSVQHETDFVEQAQAIAQADLGFDFPESMLADCWIKPLEIGRIYAWCVFETFRRLSDEFYTARPLDREDDDTFQEFLQQCGFHIMDVSPCADGRLAHVIRYVLRLPYRAVRRKSYAGAMFDIEDSVQKWVETEMLRYREGRPNSADMPTRYLKVAVYHHSSGSPGNEGCAAHGSDTRRAAEAALARLQAFRQGVENSFCCGASIDLLLIGVDTDNDVIRLHLPDANGEIDPGRYIDAVELYEETKQAGRGGESGVMRLVEERCRLHQGASPPPGMLRLSARLLRGNFSQIDYVRQYHGGAYRDIGHQERFIGMGIGFEEIQLRNLTYFAYLKTVEEGGKDMDVGIRIFSALNVARGLPIPLVIRCDYHGQVPGARDRAEARCLQLDEAVRTRYQDYTERGLLHTLLMVRDCHADGRAEAIGSSLESNCREIH